jgi:hypothetical protein
MSTSAATIAGMRVEKKGDEPEFVDTQVDKETGVVMVQSDLGATFRFFGTDFGPDLQIALTRKNDSFNTECVDGISSAFRMENVSANGRSGVIQVKLDSTGAAHGVYF